MERPSSPNENLGPRIREQAHPESPLGCLHRLLHPTSQLSQASYLPMSRSGHEYERRLLGLSWGLDWADRGTQARIDGATVRTLRGFITAHQVMVWAI